MSGIAKVAEDLTGTTKSMRKAQTSRARGYDEALSTLSGTGDLGEQFTEFGGKALSRLSQLLDDPEAIRETAGYQFRLEEGERSVERSASARGGLFSGQTLKELTRYGQEYATAERSAEMGRLASLADMGLKGGAGAAQMIGQVQIGKGESIAAGRERREAQTIAHGSSIGSSISSGFGGGGGGGGQKQDSDQGTGAGQYQGNQNNNLLGPSDDTSYWDSDLREFSESDSYGGG